jgi:uncharacterized membrane protein YadS
MWKKNLFYIGIIVSASGLIGPPLALAAGLAFGLTTVHTFHGEGRNLSKFLLQAAVVCLGFGMNLKEVVHAGASGFMYTAISITFALALGVALGKLLQVGKTQSLLISVGTAICGGSAIAAMGPVLNANEEEMAVSLGTVFVLNSVALLSDELYPDTVWAVGGAGDPRHQFCGGRRREVWADGAGSRYDGEAGACVVDCAAGDCYCNVEEE